MANYSASTDYTNVWAANTYPATFDAGTYLWINSATSLINNFMNWSSNQTDINDGLKRAEMVLVNMRYQFYRAHQTANGMQTYTSPTGANYTRPVRDMHIGGCNYRGCDCKRVITELRKFKTLVQGVRTMGEDSDNNY